MISAKDAGLDKVTQVFVMRQEELDRFTAVLSVVVVVPMPWPRTGDASHCGSRVSTCRGVYQAACRCSRSAAARLVDVSPATRCAPSGVATNARTASTAIAQGPSFSGRRSPNAVANVVNITTIVIRTASMLNVTIKAAANNVVSSAFGSPSPVIEVPPQGGGHRNREEHHGALRVGEHIIRSDRAINIEDQMPVRQLIDSDERRE